MKNNLTSIALASAVFLGSPEISLAQTIPIVDAEAVAKFSLKIGKGRNFQASDNIQFYKYHIDDGSILDMQSFDEGSSLFRLYGKSPGTTGLSLFVKEDGKVKPLNFIVTVSTSSPSSTIRLESTPEPVEPKIKTQLVAAPKPQYDPARVKSGIAIAVRQKKIIPNSALHRAAISWVDAVEYGASEKNAFRQTGISSQVVQKLSEMSSFGGSYASASSSSNYVVSEDPEPPQDSDFQPPEASSNEVEVKAPKASKADAKSERREAKRQRKEARRQAKRERKANSWKAQLDKLNKRLTAQIKRLEARVTGNKTRITALASQQTSFLAQLDSIEQQQKTFLAKSQPQPKAVAIAPKPQVVKLIAVKPKVEKPAPVAKVEPPKPAPKIVPAKVTMPVVNKTDKPLMAALPVDPFDGVEPIQMSRLLKKGLFTAEGRKAYPFASWNYKKAQTAAINLSRGETLQVAAKSSGLSVQELKSLIVLGG